MRSQKKATAEFRRNWAKAVEENRVCRFGVEPATHFRSFPTTAARDAAFAEAVAAGMPATKVPVQP